MSLTTRYMGLELSSPLVVSSSGITQSIDGIRRAADSGAGAVVVKSVFEEQIRSEVREAVESSHDPTSYPEGREYIERYGMEEAFDFHLKLIRGAKKEVAVPVIGSVHCVSAGGWTEYAKRLQDAGADAIELNLFVLPNDPKRDPRSYEQVYFDVARAVRRQVTIPVALKIGSYFSGLANTAVELSREVDALVLFNRFYPLDIDVEEMRVVAGESFSDARENLIPLRWISILSGRVACDLAATTGVHDGAGVVKQLLAGAAAVQICSALYLHNDVGYLRTILEEVESWMGRHGFRRLGDFRGRLSQKKSTDPAAHERVQFVVQTSNRPLR